MAKSKDARSLVRQMNRALNAEWEAGHRAGVKYALSQLEAGAEAERIRRMYENKLPSDFIKPQNKDLPPGHAAPKKTRRISGGHVTNLGPIDPASYD